MTRTLILLMAIALALTSDVASAEPALPMWRSGPPYSTEVATVVVGTTTVTAEIADTSPLQERGLGFREGLRPGWGMLFVYDTPSSHTFWMKGMRFCLDIVWLDADQVAGTAQSVCPEPDRSDADLSRYSSPYPVRFILELPAGWLAGHGYSTGTPVDITLPAGVAGD